MSRLLHIVLRLGPLGPFLLGMADSSFLFLPLGNDLLLVVLVAREHAIAWEYVPFAAAGSVVGIFLLDLVARKSGEAGLEKMTSRKRFDYLKRKMGQRAGYAIAVACLAPPPFPFTPVIAAASAFQYPRRKLFLIAFLSRLLRFSIVAVLAIFFGHPILSIVRSRAFFWSVVTFSLICSAGSAYSVIGWVRRSRKQSN